LAIAELQSVGKALDILREQNPGKLEQFRREVEEAGYTNPQHRASIDHIAFLPTSEFSPQDFPHGREATPSEFFEAIHRHPQPAFWLDQTDHLTNEDLIWERGDFVPAAIRPYQTGEPQDNDSSDHGSEDCFMTPATSRATLPSSLPAMPVPSTPAEQGRRQRDQSGRFSKNVTSIMKTPVARTAKPSVKAAAIRLAAAISKVTTRYDGTTVEYEQSVFGQLQALAEAQDPHLADQFIEAVKIMRRDAEVVVSNPTDLHEGAPSPAPPNLGVELDEEVNRLMGTPNVSARKRPRILFDLTEDDAAAKMNQGGLLRRHEFALAQDIITYAVGGSTNNTMGTVTHEGTSYSVILFGDRAALLPDSIAQAVHQFCTWVLGQKDDAAWMAKAPLRVIIKALCIGGPVSAYSLEEGKIVISPTNLQVMVTKYNEMEDEGDDLCLRVAGAYHHIIAHGMGSKYPIAPREARKMGEVLPDDELLRLLGKQVLSVGADTMDLA